MFKANNRVCANISSGQSEEVINDTAGKETTPECSVWQ